MGKAIFLLLVALAWIIGWGLNIYKLVTEDFLPLTGMVVGRVIGVFLAPLGAILGWF